MPISTRALMVVTVALLVAVAVAAWWITRQPPLTPVPVPSVSLG